MNSEFAKTLASERCKEGKLHWQEITTGISFSTSCLLIRFRIDHGKFVLIYCLRWNHLYDFDVKMRYFRIWWQGLLAVVRVPWSSSTVEHRFDTFVLLVVFFFPFVFDFLTICLFSTPEKTYQESYWVFSRMDQMMKKFQLGRVCKKEGSSLENMKWVCFVCCGQSATTVEMLNFLSRNTKSMPFLSISPLQPVNYFRKIRLIWCTKSSGVHSECCLMALLVKIFALYNCWLCCFSVDCWLFWIDF